MMNRTIAGPMLGTGLLLALAGCMGAIDEGGGSGEKAVPTARGLTLETRDPSHLAGRFQRGDVTLRFASERQTGGSVGPQQGQSLVAFSRRDGSELLTIYQIGPDVRMSVLGRLETTATAGPDEAKTTDQIGDGQAFADLARTPELALLPALPAALAAAGLTAAEFPALQGIEEAAAHAERMTPPARPTTSGGTGYIAYCDVYQCGEGERFDQRTCSCVPVDNPADRGEGAGRCSGRGQTDLRHNPCNDDCRGMCGPKCTCWSSVCGDCGWHKGCETHDDACDACYDSYGALWPSCTICLTPLAAFVAKAGC